jgi:hypothetical protein
MSRPQPPRPAKLVIGLFMADSSLLAEAAPILEDRFGPPDTVSPWMAFDYTTYYRPEMGQHLTRRMLSFRDLIHQADLPGIKGFTNGVEERFSREGRRTVNIDPGYLLLERFVLATGKNFTHRIYLNDGIYADLTLLYQKGAFRTLPWTYPDYADEKMIRFLELVRRRYILDLKRTGDAP